MLTNGAARTDESHMDATQPELRPLVPHQEAPAITQWAGRSVHAVAGIGNPKRFFDLLRCYDLQVIEHPFPDHHAFEPGDIVFEDQIPVLMTEKDAVKCAQFAGPEHWMVRIAVIPDMEFIARLNALLEATSHG